MPALPLVESELQRADRMRSSAHLKSHPIHPMLVGFPLAYLGGAALIDTWARATGRSQWFRTAHHMNRLGLGSAAVAAVPGLVDYVFAVPPQSSASRRATWHMLTNISAVALFAAARIGRQVDQRPSLPAILTQLCGAGLLAAGGWMGGTLVYRNQIGVDHRYAEAGKWKVQRLSARAMQGDAIDVGGVDELSVNQMKLLRVADRRVVIGRTARGHVAFDDRCPHRGGSLCAGALVDGTVQCPWHGSQFDVHTGALRQGPAEEGIATYPVREADGRLWLHLPV
jgi:nitrite reductase/ring-hydroxylating ferredoxin subunit/uncharacterized membrane protein